MVLVMSKIVGSSFQSITLTGPMLVYLSLHHTLICDRAAGIWPIVSVLQVSNVHGRTTVSAAGDETREL